MQGSATPALKRQHPERSGETLVQPPSERAEILYKSQTTVLSELATTCFKMFQAALTLTNAKLPAHESAKVLLHVAHSMGKAGWH